MDIQNKQYDNDEHYNIIHNQHTNTHPDTQTDISLNNNDFYNISIHDDYEYSSDTEEYIKVLESINIPYTQ